MRRFVSVVAVLGLMACADRTPTSVADGRETVALLPASAHAPVVFNTQLRAENEPDAASSSESKGHAQVRIQPNGTITFSIRLNNKDAETFTRAHVHKAPAGVNGPIHWDFHEPPGDSPFAGSHPSIQGVARPRVGANVADLRANPEMYYVNVHSQAFPGGVVRGQLP
jgi:hypothetical protein